MKFPVRPALHILVDNDAHLTRPSSTYKSGKAVQTTGATSARSNTSTTSSSKTTEPSNESTRPMLGFKSFRCAGILIAGIETMPMIRQGHLGDIKDKATSAANQFYSMAF